MTVGVLWEFFEYTGDRVMKLDMQKDTVVSSIYTVELDAVSYTHLDVYKRQTLSGWPTSWRRNTMW